jgi:hypothetical protein
MADSRSDLQPAFDPSARALAHALRLWQRSQIVYESPAWLGEPEPRKAAEDIAAAHPELHDSLVSLLDDPNQLVAAYALITLELMRSSILGQLPASLLQRRDKVTCVMGSFSQPIDLGGFARRIRKKHSNHDA